MGHLVIQCDNCGTSWNIYHRDNWKDWKARTCPMCGESINRDTWDKYILSAFGEMEESNLELVKDHTQYHGTLFTVGYEPDVLYPNRSDRGDQIHEELGEMRDSIDNLKSVTTKLINTLIIME